MAITKLDAVSLRSFYFVSTGSRAISRYIRQNKPFLRNGTPDYSFRVCLDGSPNACGEVNYARHNQVLFRSYAEAKAYLDEYNERHP